MLVYSLLVLLYRVVFYFAQSARECRSGIAGSPSYMALVS